MASIRTALVFGCWQVAAAPLSREKHPFSILPHSRYLRPVPKEKSPGKKNSGSGLDFEAPLWAAADKMRGHMDASEYKHVCLGLIFLKYISELRMPVNAN